MRAVSYTHLDVYKRQVKRGSRRRFGLPTVAVVGYTNAGKSSLTNRLTGSAELVENALFATLDTAVRRAKTRDEMCIRDRSTTSRSRLTS